GGIAGGTDFDIAEIRVGILDLKNWAVGRAAWFFLDLIVANVAYHADYLEFFAALGIVFHSEEKSAPDRALPRKERLGERLIHDRNFLARRCVAAVDLTA